MCREGGGLRDQERDREREKPAENAECDREHRGDGGPARQPAAVQPRDRGVEADRDDDGERKEQQDLARGEYGRAERVDDRDPERAGQADIERRTAAEAPPDATVEQPVGYACLGFGDGMDFIDNILRTLVLGFALRDQRADLGLHDCRRHG